MRVIQVRGFYRKTRNGTVWVFPSVRRIEDATPELPKLKRDPRTVDLFSEIEAGEKPVDGGSDGTED